MNILSIDTSTKTFSLAISQDGRVIRYRNLYLEKVLESSIIPAIEKILRDSKLKFKDIDGFAVGLGPGSFTSLRVGLSTIKAFALVTGKPVVGISSLDILAMNVINEKADQICAIMDARRNQIYACIYSRHCEPDRTKQSYEIVVRQAHHLSNYPERSRKTSSPRVRMQAPRNDGNVLKSRIDYLLTNLDDLLDQVCGRTIFVGDGVGVYRELIEKKYAEAGQKEGACQAVFTQPKDWVPQARKLAELAYGRFIKKEYDDIESLVPLYLYNQDCQVDRSKKKS